MQTSGNKGNRHSRRAAKSESDKMKPEHIAWCRDMFAKLPDGETWCYPDAALVFRKCGNELHLVERQQSPAIAVGFDNNMKVVSHADIQDDYFADTKRHFAAAGVIVRDLTRTHH